MMSVDSAHYLVYMLLPIEQYNVHIKISYCRPRDAWKQKWVRQLKVFYSAARVTRWVGNPHRYSTGRPNGRIVIHALICLLRNVISYVMVRNYRYENFKMVSIGLHRGYKKAELVSHFLDLFRDDAMNKVSIYSLRLVLQRYQSFSLIRYKLS